MKQVLLGVGLFLVSLIVSSILVDTSVSAVSWEGKDIGVLSRAPVEVTYADGYTLCNGNEELIEVEGYGLQRQTCVFGDSLQFRFARFFESGKYKYAIAFPRQSQFHEIRGVCATPHCVYSPETDMLIEHVAIDNYRYGAVIHKSVSLKMLKQIDPSTLRDYYLLNTDDEFGTPVRNSEYTYEVNAVNFSNNGQWAILELPTFGFVRLNTKTLEMKRVVAPGAEYGLMNDPSYELAITNDGQYFATTGYRAGASIYEVTDYCGGRIDSPIQKYFEQNEIRCKSIQGFGPLLDGAFAGYNLRFNDKGDRLGFSISYRDGRRERVLVGSNQSGREPLYLALGDSFSSGEGELDDKFYKVGTNDTTGKCHISRRSYPYLIGIAWGISTENIACSGARTVDIFGKDNYFGQNQTNTNDQKNDEQTIRSYQPGVVRQSEFVSTYLPKVVSIGIGGNDAGLVSKLASCLGLGDCEWVADSNKRTATASEIAGVYPRIRAMIRSLREASPETQYVLIGYPKLINTGVDAKCDIVTKSLLSFKEREFINESIHYLNQVMEAASGAEGVQFVSIEHSFTGSELCGSTGSMYMNGIRFGNDIAAPFSWAPFKVFGAESYHPTPMGHAAISKTILDKFKSFAEINNCQECRTGASIPKPSPYWGDEHLLTGARQYENTFLRKLVYRAGETMSVSLPRLSFLKHSKVIVELRSDPKILSNSIATEEGAFVDEVTIPIDTEPGYHVLHVIGTAPDGTEVDVYRTIAVTSDKDEVSMGASLNNQAGEQVSAVEELGAQDDAVLPANQKTIQSKVDFTRQSSTLGIRDIQQNSVKPLKKSYDSANINLAVLLIVGVSVILVALISLVVAVKIKQNAITPDS